LRSVLHRSARRRARHALAPSLALLALVSPARAGADEPPVPVPADAPTVLGPTASGATLIAFAHGAELCVAVQRAGRSRPTRVPPSTESSDQADGGCVETPVLRPFDAQPLWEIELDHEGPDEDGRFTLGGAEVVIGVAGAGAASVELRSTGAPGARVDAVALPLPGAPGELRLFATETTGSAVNDDLEEVAVLDAFGALRQVTALPWASFLGTDRGGRALQRGAAGSLRWTLLGSRSRALAATPLLPDRHVEQACVNLSAANLAMPVGCVGPDAAPPLSIAAGTSCPPLGVHVAVLARAPVRRVVAVLTDGRRRTVGLTGVPGAPADTRAGVAALGLDRGVRRVVGLDADGREVGRTELGFAPVRAGSCPDQRENETSAYTSLSRPVGPADAPLRAAPHVARAVDSGLDICVAVDRAPRVPEDCALPPGGLFYGLLTAQPTAAGGAHLLGIEPVDVTAARLTYDDGATAVVPATPIAGYTGIYANLVRTIEVDVPAGRRVLAHDLLDARGRVLQAYPGPQYRALRRASTLARDRTGLPTTLTVAQALSSPGVSALCVGHASMDSYYDCDVTSAPGGTRVMVRADCASRRTIVLGVLRRRTDRLVVGTTAGRKVTARAVAAPVALRRTTGAWGVAVAVLPAREGVRAFTLAGRATVHGTPGLPGAGAQCGYTLGAV
jgi:hypothetical protein